MVQRCVVALARGRFLFGIFCLLLCLDEFILHLHELLLYDISSSLAFSACEACTRASAIRAL